MTWTKIDGRGLDLPGLKEHIKGLKFTDWRPSGMALHNTGAPSIAQWVAESGPQRMVNLTRYYQVEQKWSAGPHAFVDDDKETPWWMFTPLNKRGVHSPSFNGTRLGIEMVGNYTGARGGDVITSGRGRVIYRNTVALFALIHAKMGWDPDSIKLHKEDPATTHDCPGSNIKKPDFIAAVKDYMGSGGEHTTKDEVASPPAKVRVGKVRTPGDTLNLRATASGSGKVLDELQHGVPLEVLGSAKNASTTWLNVRAAGKTGWVSSQFVTLT